MQVYPPVSPQNLIPRSFFYQKNVFFLRHIFPVQPSISQQRFPRLILCVSLKVYFSKVYFLKRISLVHPSILQKHDSPGYIFYVFLKVCFKNINVFYESVFLKYSFLYHHSTVSRAHFSTCFTLGLECFGHIYSY